jgi:hypothetical protein
MRRAWIPLGSGHASPRAPAVVVRAACDLRVRARAHDRSELRLTVAFDHRLRGPAAFLTTDERHFGADLDVDVDHREREVRALVVAVARERRDADHLGAVEHLVVRSGRVAGERDALRRPTTTRASGRTAVTSPATTSGSRIGSAAKGLRNEEALAGPRFVSGSELGQFLTSYLVVACHPRIALRRGACAMCPV